MIDQYLELCRTGTDLDMTNTDQQVPQTLSHHTIEAVPHAPVRVDPQVATFDLQDFVLEEIHNPYTPAPSAGCTTVTEVADQQLTEAPSPCNMLMDLDLYPGADATMYDQTGVKKEPWDTCSPVGFIEEETNELGAEDILYFATKDIMDEVKTLGVSYDPTQWSTEDVSRWLKHMCKKYNIVDVPLDLFIMNGKCLCLLSEEDFLWRSAGSGTLYAQLQIWKNYFQLDDMQETMLYADHQSMMTSQHTPSPLHRSPSPYSLPPDSPNSSSLDSSASSNLGTSPTVVNQSMDELYTQSSVFERLPNVGVCKRVRSSEHKQTIHLWQFLKELLLKPESFSGCIKWVDRSKGIFKIEDSSRVAKEWGRRKNRPAMNYDKLSRSIRQYYKKGIIKKTEHSKRLVYQFCPGYL